MDELSSDTEIWRQVLGTEGSRLHRSSKIFRMLPSSPRCRICYSPFAGPGGLLMRFTGRAPSRMNPYMCGYCERMAKAHPGGAVIPLSLLFADIRGSSQLAEKLGTVQFSALIARFYNAVTNELIQSDGLIDRLIGDEVIALFVPGLAGGEHAHAAIQAAHRILKVTGHGSSDGPWVPLGVGVHTGHDFVGAVGASGVSDITALGDDVNLTARLASVASAGEILVTEAARAAAGLSNDGLEERDLDLKGRSTSIKVWLTHLAADAAARNPET